MARGGRSWWARLGLAFCCLIAAVEALNVSYDHRALKLDGQRKLLISAGIHYPRATPQMWPKLIADAKEGGANIIQTYVFWSGHEPQKGQYYFEDRYDLVKFVRLVGEAGLYLNLRIGPYICAEWNFGGLPSWLRDVPGIEFRTDNEPFKDEMRTFVKLIVDMMKNEKLFSWQGGPIILAQIENEYGDIEWAFGKKGQQYVKWTAEFAESLQIGVPWIMCQQWDAPANIITTCNGYYCDSYTSSTPGAPKMWTEDWNGWYLTWGGYVPHRTAEDQAFAVARFYQRGGSFHNYYMYFGGTNFERTSGGPFVTTSYDYDAPLDEYGLVNQPKWGHLKELHEVLYLVEAAMFASDDEPIYLSLGPYQEAHVYASSAQGNAAGSDLQGESCVAFLANIDESSNAVVEFNGRKYDLPSWSVSILPDCKTVVFNTAKVSVQTSVMHMKRQPGLSLSLNGHQPHLLQSIVPNSLEWESHEEPIEDEAAEAITAKDPLEQIKTTKDLTDYLWYITRFEVSEEDAGELTRGTGQAHLVVHEVRDAVHIFVNGKLAGSATGWWIHVDQPVTLHEGVNEIAMLSMTVGLTNYGAFYEREGAGIRGSVQVEGLSSGIVDLTSSNWVHQVGLRGEKVNLFTDKGAASVSWVSTKDLPSNKPLIWYKTHFKTPDGQDPVAVDLGSMGKGQLFVNGHHLGRYWPTLLAPEEGCSGSCDYRGAYYAEKCATQCGQPTQRWYHIPREWLEKSKDNLLVLFEEMGGDPSPISVATRSHDIICASVSDSHPPPVNKWVRLSKSNPEHPHPQNVMVPEVRLECGTGQHISHILFASFGNPTGTCSSFQEGTCHSLNSSAVIEKACKGKRYCVLPVSVDAFGKDPCPGRPKSLVVQALCRDPEDLSSVRYMDVDHFTTSEKRNRWQRDEGLSIVKNSNRWQRVRGSEYGEPNISVLPLRPF